MLASNNVGLSQPKNQGSSPNNIERASNALSASLYKSSISIMEEFLRSSASAADRSWCDIEARTSVLEEAEATYRGYATAEKLEGSR